MLWPTIACWTSGFQQQNGEDVNADTKTGRLKTKASFNEAVQIQQNYYIL